MGYKDSPYNNSFYLDADSDDDNEKPEDEFPELPTDLDKEAKEMFENEDSLDDDDNDDDLPDGPLPDNPMD